MHNIEWLIASPKEKINLAQLRKNHRQIEKLLDMETMNIVDTQMYIDGYQMKLISDTSYGSLWEVSFTLKEF